MQMTCLRETMKTIDDIEYIIIQQTENIESGLKN